MRDRSNSLAWRWPDEYSPFFKLSHSSFFFLWKCNNFCSHSNTDRLIYAIFNIVHEVHVSDWIEHDPCYYGNWLNFFWSYCLVARIEALGVSLKLYLFDIIYKQIVVSVFCLLRITNSPKAAIEATVKENKYLWIFWFEQDLVSNV